MSDSSEWAALIRDAPLGFFLNWISQGKLFPYRDQKKGYQIPEKYIFEGTREASPNESKPEARDLTGYEGLKAIQSGERRLQAAGCDSDEDIKEKFEAEQEKYVLVTWDSESDRENPQNWKAPRKVFYTCLMVLNTFACYAGSSIYVSSISGIMEDFNVPYSHAELGLAMYILAYGIGPMLLNPFEDHYALGRNPINIAGLGIALAFQCAICEMKSLPPIVGLRFLVGFFGSPWLACGPAICMDMVRPGNMMYAVLAWDEAAAYSPTLAPIFSSFAGYLKGWQWPMYIHVWILALSFLLSILFFPETSESNLLYRKAQRLRKLTKNDRITTQAELDAKKVPFAKTFKDSLLLPFILTREPSIMFSNIYLGIVYGVFYLWFESFPIVFGEIFQMNEGIEGILYVAFSISTLFSMLSYLWFIRARLIPNLEMYCRETEKLMNPALYSGALFPISLFIFGWTAWRSTHWIGPLIGASLFLPALNFLFLAIYGYLTYSYPRYAALACASNGLFRSLFAFSFPIFGRFYFEALSVGGGCSLLAGVLILAYSGMGYFKLYGKDLRRRSRFAVAVDLDEHGDIESVHRAQV